MGNGVARAFCCCHLKENFCKCFTRGLEPYIWWIAHAKTSDSYEEPVFQLWKLGVAAANYLTNIDKALWVTAFFLGQSYGHISKNIILHPGASCLRYGPDTPGAYNVNFSA